MADVIDRGAHLLLDDQRDYNHATDGQYKQLRDKASHLYDQRNKLSQQSQHAYKAGNKQKAHELSEEAKKLVEQAENYNRQAADYVFRANNTDSAGDEIDLHGLYVKEAEFFLQNRIAADIQASQSHLKVIVGKGKHSANGIAKLKPAIDQMCTDSGLKHRVDPHNSGVIIIDLKNSSSGQIPNHWDLGYGGGTPHQQGGYQGTPQPQYYQQTQNNNNNNNNFNNIKTGNKFFDLLIKGFCICLDKNK